MATITGTSNNDSLRGTSLADAMYGLLGNDSLSGETGKDSLYGGDGDDRLNGGGGQDYYDGGAGYDTVDFLDNDNPVRVNASLATGRATFIGLPYPAETLVGIESLAGGNLGDILTGDAGSNSLDGRTGNDIIDGGDGADFLVGGYGSDSIFGNGGDDILYGEEYWNLRVAGDTLDGGAGFDFVSYASAYENLRIDLVLRRVSQINSDAADTIRNVESILGGVADDFINGDTVANSFDGDAGDDTLQGGGGNDSLTGGLGDDILWGAGGRDEIDGGDGFDIAIYRDNTSPIRFDLTTGVVSFSGTAWPAEMVTSIEGAEGGSGRDTLLGTSGDNYLAGGGGADTLQGGAGADTLDGGAGNDTVNGGNGIDTVSFASISAATTIDLANQTAYATASPTLRDKLISIEAAMGGSGKDIVRGTSTGDTLDGGAGADSVQGNSGSDTLLGGYGNDTVRGGAGNDLLTGGLFAEETTFPNRQFDLADDGIDLVDGGDGIDTIVLPELSFYDFSYEDEFYVLASAAINLTAGTFRTSYSPSLDTLVSIENVLTGSGQDTVVGSAAANLIEVGDGSNVVNAGGGNDTIFGGYVVYEDDDDGEGDHLEGGAGNDLIYGNGSSSWFFYGPGYGSSPGRDYLAGGEGDDTLYTGPAFATMSGGSGADEFHLTDEQAADSYRDQYFLYYNQLVIEDFNRDEGDHFFVDMKDTQASVRFVGETEALETYDMGYHVVENEDGTSDTVTRIRMQDPDSWGSEFIQLTLTNYTDGLFAQDFTFT